MRLIWMFWSIDREGSVSGGRRGRSDRGKSREAALFLSGSTGRKGKRLSGFWIEGLVWLRGCEGKEKENRSSGAFGGLEINLSGRLGLIFGRKEGRRTMVMRLSCCLQSMGRRKQGCLFLTFTGKEEAN
ncbi:uncharacterized protein LOC111880941 [Lactuca sativa]|uniref:uncharacterized protein LOC111880941 n=1 Tax=Lactuca sativa TaxID=4236 RepID=UPI000CD81BEA|nr:uncharacterized protein LOC111880941 [Lactuca sativa]